MFRHSLKLIWNRRRANALIILELVIAFLVVFAVAAVAASALYRYQQPLGFEWQGTWEMRISTGGEWAENDGRKLQQVLGALRDLPEVEWAHVLYMPLFRNSSWTSTVENGGRYRRARMNRMTDGGPEDFGVRLLEGRWFNQGDAATEDEEVVINAQLRDALFPAASALGELISEPNGDSPDQARRRVIGVFEDLRQRGELFKPDSYVIGRFPAEDLEARARTIQLRLSPGTPVDFEQTLQPTVEPIAKTWRVGFTPLRNLRSEQLRSVLIPLTIFGLIAAFLLLMVAFGLFGVLWQNVTRRTDELGLRRAVGATRARLYRQIMLETVVLSVDAERERIESINWRSSLLGAGAAAAVLVAVASLCSLYPAWLAARRSPAEALHYE